MSLGRTKPVQGNEPSAVIGEADFLIGSRPRAAKEIDDLPNGWTRTILGQLSGGRGRSVEPAKTPDKLFELYSVPSFPGKRPEVVLGKEVGSNKRIVAPCSVLLCKINPRINRAWVVGDFTSHAKIASTEWIVFPATEEVVPDFLCYFLQRNAVRDFLAHNASGVGGSLMRVKTSTLRNFPFAYPSPEEQRRVVAEIEKQFTRLDVAVAALGRVQANLKRYRAAVLKAACEGRLVPIEGNRKSKFESGEDLLARILDVRRRKWNGKGKYEEPVRPDISKLPPLPKDWVWANIGQLRVFSLYGPRFSSDDYADDGYVVLRTSDISESGRVDSANAPRLRLSKEEFERYRAQRGDLLVTRTGSLGTLAIFDDDVDAIPGAYLIQFRLATEPITTRYLFYFLKSPAGQSYLAGKGAGVGRPNLNAPTIEALTVPLPPLVDQVRIVAEIERRLSVVEELEAVVSANIQRATRLRQSILQRAFDGELVPKEAADQPANVIDFVEGKRPLAPNAHFVAKRA